MIRLTKLDNEEEDPLPDVEEVGAYAEDSELVVEIVGAGWGRYWWACQGLSG